jgi:hypothetical protein
MYPLPITAMGVFVIGEFTEDASLRISLQKLTAPELNPKTN